MRLFAAPCTSVSRLSNKSEQEARIPWDNVGRRIPGGHSEKDEPVECKRRATNLHCPMGRSCARHVSFVSTLLATQSTRPAVILVDSQHRSCKLSSITRIGLRSPRDAVAWLRVSLLFLDLFPSMPDSQARFVLNSRVLFGKRSIPIDALIVGTSDRNEGTSILSGTRCRSVKLACRSRNSRNTPLKFVNIPPGAFQVSAHEIRGLMNHSRDYYVTCYSSAADPAVNTAESRCPARDGVTEQRWIPAKRILGAELALAPRETRSRRPAASSSGSVSFFRIYQRIHSTRPIATFLLRGRISIGLVRAAARNRESDRLVHRRKSF